MDLLRKNDSPMGLGSCDITPSLLERLTRQKGNLEAQLEKVNGALHALKSNPKVADVVEAISKISNIY